MCVDDTLLPSGKLFIVEISVWCRFLMDVPFMIKTEGAPVSAIACDAAIAIAFAHSNCLYFVVQFDAITVALSSSYDDSAAS
jgi:hypothetical protein